MNPWPSPGEPLARWLLLACALTGCAVAPRSLARQDPLPGAWRDACAVRAESASLEAEKLDEERRRLLRSALAAQTAATFSARALSREALHRRLGGAVFPREVVLLVTHLEVSAHPGSRVVVTPRLVVAGQRLAPLGTDLETWSFVGIERPRPGYGPSLKRFSAPGAIVDVLVGGITVGMLDLNLRGQKDLIDPGSPGSPGTGAALQQQTLLQLENAERAAGSRDERSDGRLGEPADRFYLLGASSLDRDSDPLALDSAPPTPPGDALILRVQHSADRATAAVCGLRYDLVIPLPAGGDLGARVNAVFARGPLSLGAP